MDNQKDPQESKVVERQAADLSRRQIIRGMAAVPMVLTLTNANAQAIASNLMCITNSESVLRSRDTDAPDVNDRHCINVANTTPIVPTRPGIVEETATADSGFPIRSTPSDSPNNVDYSQQACVHYVDSNGNFVAYEASSGGIPVAASCYTSFA